MELVVCPQCFLHRHMFIECYDIQHNDTPHNGTQHKDTQHKDIQHNDTQHIVLVYDTQLNWILCILLSVVKLNVAFYLLLC